jgi:iron complex outermembrane recepter protein
MGIEASQSLRRDVPNGASLTNPVSPENADSIHTQHSSSGCGRGALVRSFNYAEEKVYTGGGQNRDLIRSYVRRNTFTTITTIRWGEQIMRIATILAVALFGATCLADPKHAQAAIQHYQLNIPRQSLDTALNDLAQQTGLQIGRFSGRIDGSAMVGPVKGDQTPEQALKTLLYKTGLNYKIVSDTTIAVYNPKDPTPSTTGLTGSGSSPGIPGEIRGEGSGLQLAQSDSSSVPSPQSSALELAQSTVPTGNEVKPPQEDANKIPEIVVTAQKRNEPVTQVPGSVAVVSADTLTNSGATELRDLNGLVPGLQVTGATGSGEIVIRGVTTGSDVGSTSALVLDGVVVGPEDETGIGNGFSPQFDPAIISRIEVLKGPQGTLYGGSTLGGLVMYETVKPTLTVPYGGVYVEGSDTEHGGGNYILRANVSAPIVQDKLGFSLSANEDDLSGFIKAPELGDRTYNTHKNTGVRGALLWQANPDLQVQVSDYYTRQRSFTDQVILTPSTPASSLTYDSGVLPIYNTEFNMFAVNASYDLHWATLSYVGSYQTGTGQLQVSLENSPSQAIYQVDLPLFGGATVPAGDELGVPKVAKFDKHTSELKLASPDSGPFRWLAGIYYVTETDTLDEYIGAIDLATQSPKAGAVGNLQSFFLTSNLRQVAEYGDVTYYILPKLDITGGIRIGEYQESYLQAAGGADFAAYNALGSLFGFTPTPAVTPAGHENSTVETYQANLRYHITADNMVYFRFATGYRPGGPNDIIFGSPPTYGPDTTDNFELGWKTTFWNSKAYLEVAAYDILWHNIQVEASQNGIGYLTNGGAAEIKGVEAALTLRPIQGLNLNAAFSYTDGKLTQTAPGGTGDAGDTIPNTPRFSGSLSADYTQPVGGGLDGFIGASARYVDVRDTAFEHSLTSENTTLPPYTIVDLRVGVRKGPYEVTAFVRNIGDNRAVLGGVDSSGETLLVIARPRTFGVSLSAKY